MLPESKTSAKKPNKRAVVLLSGGLDSATVLAIARSKGFELNAMTFRYGQRHEHEISAARKIAERVSVTRHSFVNIDLRQFGASALTSDIDVPRHRDLDADDIPVTYVPARNTIFLSFALAWAEVIDADSIWIGVNALDYSGYPDCRPEYIAAFQHLASLATRAGVEGRAISIEAPLQQLTKGQIISLGASLGVEYGATTSCYDPDESGRSCGECDACQLRKRGFKEAGMADPTSYVQ
jgi:7-cyano-7-deazaguanine synthase